MAKVLEGPGMDLFKKWGMAVPNHVVLTSADQFDPLAQVNAWMRNSKLVVKAHEAIGSRMKLGLVKVDLDLAGAKKAVTEMLGKNVGSGLTVSQVIVSEMVPHSAEYYIAVKSTREGADLMMASVGGIEIESQWDKVQHVIIEVGEPASAAAIEAAAKKADFPKDLVPKVAEFAQKLFQCFDQEDAQYLEINPLVLNAAGELVALDAVTLLDGDAKFRHPDWNFTFASEFGRPYTDDERQIMEIDSRVKGSVKFIEIPGGDTALLPAGGGASVFYSDAVVARGGTLANYAEYSGDPPDWAVEALTDKVCSLPGIKRIIVGGAIANFTDVKKTFTGIIAGFRRAKADGKLKNVTIFVRRGGPKEAEGLAAMRALADEGFDIQVYDRYTPLTDIVDFAIQGKG
ncbi:MAG: ATP citrate lyase citrate-binding domain-containing protein [Nitrospirota bacterium]